MTKTITLAILATAAFFAVLCLGASSGRPTAAELHASCIKDASVYVLPGVYSSPGYRAALLRCDALYGGGY